ncbi:MAG: YgjV family protein [Oscillospiraceae bacterium]|nr:YgjV family protein [Oscillospiraceae bacterium]
MNWNLIIGNAFSLFAMISDSISSSRKTSRGVLGFQTMSQVFFGTGTFILGGYSGAVQNCVSVLRNLAAIFKLNFKLLEWLLIGFGVGFGIYFNNLGVIGWLPILANLEYALAVYFFKEEPHSLKIAFLINIALFAVFNTVILNLVGVIANIVVFVITAVFLVRERKGRKE